MQIILLDKIANLGNSGDQVSVKSGFARNFLIPQGKAVQATKKNIEYFKTRRAELKSKLDKIIEIARSRAEKINALGVLTFSSKAGEGGKLFGSIGVYDIIKSVNEATDVKIVKKEVRLPNGPLRIIGKHKINFQLHSEVFAQLIIDVIAK